MVHARRLVCTSILQMFLLISILRIQRSHPPSHPPIKQRMQKNMLFSVQGQGLQEWSTQSISLVIKSDWMAGLELLGTLAMEGGEGLQTAARLSCYAIKTCSLWIPEAGVSSSQLFLDSSYISSLHKLTSQSLLLGLFFSLSKLSPTLGLGTTGYGLAPC